MRRIGGGILGPYAMDGLGFWGPVLPFFSREISLASGKKTEEGEKQGTGARNRDTAADLR